jgi:hypothetical protein
MQSLYYDNGYHTYFNTYLQTNYTNKTPRLNTDMFMHNKCLYWDTVQKPKQSRRERESHKRIYDARPIVQLSDPLSRGVCIELQFKNQSNLRREKVKRIYYGRLMIQLTDLRSRGVCIELQFRNQSNSRRESHKRIYDARSIVQLSDPTSRGLWFNLAVLTWITPDRGLLELA